MLKVVIGRAETGWGITGGKQWEHQNKRCT